MNTLVFGQHDPGKTPMGKTSKREMYIYGSQANATNKEKNNGT
jgi:hypothetical protein